MYRRLLRFVAESPPAAIIIGGVLAFIHLGFSWFILFKYVYWGSRDAQWQMIYFMFWGVDFPISMLQFAFNAFVPDVFPEFIDVYDVVVPTVLYGLLAPVWYFALPLVIGRLFRALKRGGTRYQTIE